MIGRSNRCFGNHRTHGIHRRRAVPPRAPPDAMCPAMDAHDLLARIEAEPGKMDRSSEAAA